MHKTRRQLSKTNFGNLFFILLLSAWILVSLLSIFYNAQKSISEAKQWIPLTDSQKKYLIFGDMYSFFTFIKGNTAQTATVLLYPHTEEMFYRGIYELYPRKTFTAKNSTELINKIHTQEPLYVATYDSKIEMSGYEEIASFSGKQNNYGILYKKQ